MPNLIKSNALTFDDVLLVPRFSDIASRKQVDISTSLFGVPFPVPICSANMDTVTEAAMANKMFELGGLGILHRYATHETVLQWIKEVHDAKSLAIPSIGIKPEDFDNAMKYAEEGVLAINVDIAHGDSQHMVDMVKRLTKEGLDVIAGNVATRHGAKRLADAGAKVIKVGIGPGSLCTTRIVTGHGVPQLSAIEDVADLTLTYDISIIADGGIRNAGDCVKALAFGADMVMIGSLFAGTKESPGKPVQLTNEQGKYYWAKEYRGMASRAARNSVAETDSSYTPEGESTFVRLKGPVKDTVDQLVGGIRSGLSYSGVHSLRELRVRAEYVTITGNGMAESKPHLLTR
jgi:IMP dehydrogenase